MAWVSTKQKRSSDLADSGPKELSEVKRFAPDFIRDKRFSAMKGLAVFACVQDHFNEVLSQHCRATKCMGMC